MRAGWRGKPRTDDGGSDGTIPSEAVGNKGGGKTDEIGFHETRVARGDGKAIERPTTKEAASKIEGGILARGTEFERG